MTTETFIKQIRTLGYTNPFDSREIVVGNIAVIEVFKDNNRPNTIHLSSIRTVEPGKGNASKVLEKLLSMARKNKVSISLSPVKFGNKGLSSADLKKWYTRHGFKSGQYGSMIYLVRSS
jgi:hypothetical protein